MRAGTTLKRRSTPEVAKGKRQKDKPKEEEEGRAWSSRLVRTFERHSKPANGHLNGEFVADDRHWSLNANGNEQDERSQVETKL
jgi:hypothetical protein